jgi:hypothetical protein
VAQAAFGSCYRGHRDGRVRRLDNRGDLLALLTHPVACKAVNPIAHEVRMYRGGVKKKTRRLDGGGRDCSKSH